MGQDRWLVAQAFCAVFMQQQAWWAMIQIGEASRLTYRVQMMNLTIVLIHLLIISVLWVTNLLTLQLLFTIIILEYILAIAVSLKVFNISALPKESFDGREVFRDYMVYCSPLIIYSLMGFAYEFSDRWLLQNFGGSEEQGLFEVGYRFSTVSLLAATSLVNIFWKEFAEA